MGYRVLDLFCGTGGFSQGLCEGLGPESKVIFGIDLADHGIQTFKANNPGTTAVSTDIRRYPPAKAASRLGISDSSVDVIVGGPPCQGFTSIRPHRSKEDEDLRNTLYLDFFSYVDFFRPKVFIMENVVGLATHHDGKTLRRIMARASALGYRSDWRIMNAANFGVPQRRERLIIIGLRDKPEVEFPRPTHLNNGQTIGYYDKSKLISVVPEIDDTRALAKAMTAWEAISDLPPLEAGQEAKEYTKGPQNEYQKKMRLNSQKLVLHYATAHGRRMLGIIRKSGYNIDALPKGTVKSGFSTSYSRIEADKPSVTLTGNFPFPGSNKCIHPFQDRAITPREAARLQSFPDDFVFCGNRTEVAKLIGNAVPPLLGNTIGAWIERYL